MHRQCRRSWRQRTRSAVWWRAHATCCLSRCAPSSLKTSSTTAGAPLHAPAVLGRLRALIHAWYHPTGFLRPAAPPLGCQALRTLSAEAHVEATPGIKKVTLNLATVSKLNDSPTRTQNSYEVEPIPCSAMLHKYASPYHQGDVRGNPERVF